MHLDLYTYMLINPMLLYINFKRYIPMKHYIYIYIALDFMLTPVRCQVKPKFYLKSSNLEQNLHLQKLAY